MGAARLTAGPTNRTRIRQPLRTQGVKNIDISRSPKQYLPRSNSTAGGVLKSLGLLAAALLVSAAAGVAGYLLIRLLAPGVPAFVGLPIGAVVLLLVLRWIGQRFQWIMPWYYLLPAIIFLLTFTFFPVVLTIGLAFTDYAGIRNGELNPTTETTIESFDGVTFEVGSTANLACHNLRNGCNGVRAVVYASGDLEIEGAELDGTILTLADAPPAGREVQTVELYMPDLGFADSVRVVEQDGAQLTLQRAPPFPADLSSVTLQLDRAAIQRTIVSTEGTTLTLDRPLPEGSEPVSIARYNDFGWVGWRNFRQIMASAPRALIPVFVWNISFAIITVFLNMAAGILIAVLLNNKALRFRNFYRTLLIIPWALPSVITIQVWKGFLNQNFGAINRVLALLDISAEPINWLLGDANAARAAVILVNLWLGLPFMMTATLGALSAIPDEIYEAARIDGASPWQGFWNVTGPLLRTALVPIALSTFAFNFNNFNVIFLLTDGGPPVPWGTATARGTDILISWAYNEAFRSQGGYAYGFGSAISLIIFVITLAVSLMNFRVTGALKDEARI